MAVTIPFVPTIEVNYGRSISSAPSCGGSSPRTLEVHLPRNGHLHRRRRRVAVVDPGPTLDAHRDALATALRASGSGRSSSPTAMPTTRRWLPG